MEIISVSPGTVFGRLTVVEEDFESGGRRAMFCRCECGREKRIELRSLRSGRTTSCGCLHSERVSESNTTHGMWHHEHYILWRNITDRCLDPGSDSYQRYGARGITVCEEWRDAAAFCAWMDANMGSRPPGMSLDRIRNDGNYEPGNVRWNDATGQIRNSRVPRITMDIAEEIRRRYAAGERQRLLAAEFRIGQQSVSRIITGQTWKAN